MSARQLAKVTEEHLDGFLTILTDQQLRDDDSGVQQASQHLLNSDLTRYGPLS